MSEQYFISVYHFYSGSTNNTYIDVMRSILYKEDSLQQSICACHSSEGALHNALDVT